jgi:hypothetical protein
LAERPPNVVFVLTDDQGYPPLGANGHLFVQTPNLDGFCAEAVRFEQFHSGATCAPTRAGLLTALAIEAARVEVDGSEAVEKPVGEGQSAAVLTVRLAAGSRHLRAWFAGPSGLMQSPYYVEVGRPAAAAG